MATGGLGSNAHPRAAWASPSPSPLMRQCLVVWGLAGPVAQLNPDPPHAEPSVCAPRSGPGQRRLYALLPLDEPRTHHAPSAVAPRGPPSHPTYLFQFPLAVQVHWHGMQRTGAHARAVQGHRCAATSQPELSVATCKSRHRGVAAPWSFTGRAGRGQKEGPAGLLAAPSPTLTSHERPPA